MADISREAIVALQEAAMALVAVLDTVDISPVIEESDYETESRHDGIRDIGGCDLHQVVSLMDLVQAKAALIRVVDGWNGPDAIMEALR